MALVIACCLLGIASAVAQPTIVSTVPANNSTGVSTSAGVVFTFSAAMDPTQTSAAFYTESPFAAQTTTPVWSSDNTVLTCTPSPAFPASSTIIWVVTGQDPDGDTLTGIPEGMFTTGTSTNGGGGGVTTGFGTNKYTSFVVGKAVSYDQLTAGEPTLETNYAYEFFGSIVLASNVTATSASVTLPSSTVSNFNSDRLEPDLFYMIATFTNQSDLDDTFAPGTYGFALSGGNSNLQVTVDFPSTWTQPNAPHINNFAAAQAVDPTQPFTLTWDAFSGGTAKDYIVVVVGNFGNTPLNSNTFPGTATADEIPANILTANTTYNCTMGFLHASGTTNEANAYTDGAYVETITQFSLTTTNGISVIPTPPTLVNPILSGNTINFSVNATPNQNVTVQFNSSGLASGGWQTLMTTNSGSGVFQVSDTINTANNSVFYRAFIAP